MGRCDYYNLGLCASLGPEFSGWTCLLARICIALNWLLCSGPRSWVKLREMAHLNTPKTKDEDCREKRRSDTERTGHHRVSAAYGAYTSSLDMARRSLDQKESRRVTPNEWDFVGFWD